jgi:hypothetical protein
MIDRHWTAAAWTIAGPSHPIAANITRAIAALDRLKLDCRDKNLKLMSNSTIQNLAIFHALPPQTQLVILQRVKAQIDFEDRARRIARAAADQAVRSALANAARVQSQVAAAHPQPTPQPQPAPGLWGDRKLWRYI